MLIRDARPAEHQAVARLMVAAYEQYAPLMSAPAWRMFSADIAAVESRAARAALLVAEDEGRVGGAVTLYGPQAPSPAPDGWSYMRLLAVAPPLRGRGAGRALVEEAIARSRRQGAAGMAIHTTPWMEAALGLYRSLGFDRDPSLDFQPLGEELVDGAPLRVLGYRLALSG